VHAANTIKPEMSNPYRIEPTCCTKHATVWFNVRVHKRTKSLKSDQHHGTCGG
jgi:hypothetical protein